MKQKSRLHQPAGFTLIELLTVIAIIGILSAILVPTVGRVRDNARRTQSRATFTTWAQAIEMFRQEYGFWPDFSSRFSAGQWTSTEPLRPPDRNLVIRLNDNATTRRNFVEFLTGYQIDGSEFPPGASYRSHPNRKRVRFHSFTENEFINIGSGNLDVDGQNIRFVDAFQNDDIIIAMDGNLNGIVALGTEIGTYGVSGTESPTTLVTPYDRRTEVRAGVVIYSGGRGGSNAAIARDNMIRTW